MNLLAKTDSEDWNFAGEVEDRFAADSSISIWMSRAGTYNQLCRIFFDQFVQTDFVVSKDGDCSTFQHQVLVDIPGEGIVVVNEN